MNRPQTAHTGKIITILWVQLLQAQDHSIFYITDTFDFILITVWDEALTFGGDEELLLDLVSVGITEVDDSKRGTTAGVVDDVTDDTLKQKS